MSGSPSHKSEMTVHIGVGAVESEIDSASRGWSGWNVLPCGVQLDGAAGVSYSAGYCCSICSQRKKLVSLEEFGFTFRYLCMLQPSWFGCPLPKNNNNNKPPTESPTVHIPNALAHGHRQHPQGCAPVTPMEERQRVWLIRVVKQRRGERGIARSGCFSRPRSRLLLDGQQLCRARINSELDRAACRSRRSRRRVKSRRMVQRCTKTVSRYTYATVLPNGWPATRFIFGNKIIVLVSWYRSEGNTNYCARRATPRLT